jgi:uncharacterized protein YjbI with pentapeptide repeats
VEQEKKATGKQSWLSRLWARTGFGDKTVWDWLQLLIVPLVLGVIGFYFTSSQEYAHQQEFEEQRLQNAALQTYLAGMRELLLDKNLRDSKEDSEVRAVARAQTRSTLGQLSPEGKRIAIQFLYEASLIDKRDPVVDLSNADLSSVDLHLNYLINADLNEVDLSEADLSGADLSGATLNNAILSDADLRNAYIGDQASLVNADLSDANLRGATLTDANLLFADLSGANLSGADLSNARLNSAKGVSEEQLEQAKTLEGATMPD